MTLRDEIIARAAADPAFADVVATRDDLAIAAALSEKRTEVRPVTVRTLLVWSAPAIRGRLAQAASDPASPAYSIALAALDLLGQPLGETFDTVAYGALLDALQAAGIVTGAERAGLGVAAAQPAPVSGLDVRRACWSDTGEWLA